MLIRLNWSDKEQAVDSTESSPSLKVYKYTTNHTNVMRITFYDFYYGFMI